MDSFGLVVGGEGALLQPGVEFELVRGGDGGGVGEEALEFRVAEVGDADGAGFAGLQARFHGFPGVEVVGGAGEDFVAAVFIFGHEGGAPGEGGGPVHEVEVEVVGVEVLERGVEGGAHVVGVVRVVPEFGGDEDFGAGDAALLDGGADGRLSAVDAGSVDVTVAGF